MSLMSHLAAGEDVVARAGQFYATSRRLLRYTVGRDGVEKFWALPYSRVRAVELNRPPNHAYMAGGTIMALSGFVVTLTVGWMTPLLAVPMGLAFIYLGGNGKGKQQYYQLRWAGGSKEEEAVWRIPYLESMELIAAIDIRTPQKARGASLE